MADEIGFSQGKSAGLLGHEALWFVLHTLFALFTLVVMIVVMGLFNPDPNATAPKFLGTMLAFVLPLVIGFIVTKRQGDEIATYVWISGLLVFAVACVWVIDLPTGNGLCDDCAGHIFYRLQRTFFSIEHGSGLLAGNGLAIGAWVPLSMFGYAIGARTALSS